MPEMNEGDLLYMPTTLPGLSADAARALLQQTNRAIRQLPEVESRVFGKAGRADTATDPAPLKCSKPLYAQPRSEWRQG
jgi:Cu(I)/Ag(I) efflux system membrane protein CusA/SilA